MLLSLWNCEFLCNFDISKTSFNLLHCQSRRVKVCNAEGNHLSNAGLEALIERYSRQLTCACQCAYFAFIILFWVLTFKCMLLYRKCCHYKCWQNANRKTEWETNVCEQQKGRAKSREKTSEATVIVNIVIVIGSNNHILISCVYGFGSTLTLCLRVYKQNGAIRKNIFK